MCADLHVTKGDFDEDASYPEDKVCDTNLPMLLSLATNHVSTSCAGQVLKIGEFRIGMMHGHQVKYDNGSFGWCLVIHKLSTDFRACMRPRRCIMLQIVPSGSKERLAFVARQMDVDILVTGHTHEFKVHFCNASQ